RPVNARRLAILAWTLTLLPGGPLCAETFRVQGSATVAQIFALATPVVKEKFGLDLKVRAERGSSEAIHSVGVGAVELAVTTRALTGTDRSDFPERRMTEALIGMHALVFIVPADVWESGVHSITKTQARDIYEGTTKTWKPLGGTDQAIKF